MLGVIPLNVIIAVSVLVSAFAGGWVANGWRWETKLAEVELEYINQALELVQRTRALEQELTIKAELIQETKNAEIKIIRSQLDATLISLRERPSRSSSVSGAPSNGRAATGAELSREDAEFLAREASRADEVVAEYMACYARYNAAQKPLR